MVAVQMLDGQKDEGFLFDEAAVLAFLADCDMAKDVNAIPAAAIEPLPPQWDVLETLTDIGSSDSAATTPEKAVVLNPKQQRRASWRQKQKGELQHLRELAKQLAAQLDELKLATGVRSTLPVTGRAVDTVATTSELMIKLQTTDKQQTASLWEAIASRQSFLREESEQDNARLRDALKHQVLQAKSLHRALKRRLQEQAVGASLDLCKRYRLDRRVFPPPTNNKVVFDELMAGMDELYVGLDASFESVKMNELSCPGRRNNLVNSATKGIYVEFLDCYAVPFDLRRTEKAIWVPRPDGDENAGIIFAEVRQASSAGCRITMRHVSRRYAEQDRTILISRALFETMSDSIPVVLKETSLVVLKHGAPSELGLTTEMQSFRQIRGHDHCSGQTWWSHPNFSVGISVWESMITRSNNLLEDILMQGTTN
ncbi:hypothetical protein BBJ28_00004071 [Nothophytophthora sp. Chile5]|nr:hypothetical protein BBJ28_00004071 [Nothophytophthora sp. Chile5]